MLLILRSIVQCPCCGFKVTERMPASHPVREYYCQACEQIFKLSKDDCCVFCRYGSVPCPVQQREK